MSRLRDEHASLNLRVQHLETGATASQGQPPGNTSVRAERRKARQLERERASLEAARAECASRLQTELARLTVVREEWTRASTGFPMVGELWAAHDKRHNRQLRIVIGITDSCVQLEQWGNGPRSKSDARWTVKVELFVTTNRLVRVIESHDGRLRRDEVSF